MKVKNDRRSKFSNLSNWKEEAWKKNQGFNGNSNPWPRRYPCDALTTELWSHTLGARSICWVHISREEWNGVASHRYRGGHGFEFRWSPDFFQASSFQLLKLENLLQRSFFTLIYHCSSHMNYFIYTSRRWEWFTKQVKDLRAVNFGIKGHQMVVDHLPDPILYMYCSIAGWLK